MNVLLVSPYRGKTYETVGIHIPPLGLLYIAGALQHAGHTVRVVAPEYGSRDEADEHDGLRVERVRATGPRFVRYRRLQRRTRARLHELATELD